MFVAGFIGSSPINFLDVDIVKETGRIFLRRGDFKIGLPDTKALIIEKYPGGNKIILGLRPQDIFEVNDPGVSGLTDNIIKAQVDVTEPLGDRIIVVAKIGDAIIKALMPNDIKADAGDIIEFAINTRNIHFFDPDTESSI